MNLEKLKPWNWFKHEDEHSSNASSIPVTRQQANHLPAQSTGSQSLLDFHREVDRLFDNVFANVGLPSLRSGLSLGTPLSASRLYQPQLDIAGDNQHYEIVLDVPGLSESDLSIDISGDVLTIRGQKEESHEKKDKQFYRVERHYGSFQRTLSLPDDADVGGIQANLKEGVLTLTVPRTESLPNNSKRIPIMSS